MSDNDEARYTVRSLIVTGIAAIIGTVLVLEAAGRIDHTEHKDHVPVGDFKAIHIQPGDSFRMSRKSSELHAVCENGYLAIAADDNGVVHAHRKNCCAFELFHQWEMGIFRLYFKVSLIWEF